MQYFDVNAGRVFETPALLEILHSSSHDVPLGPVRDPVRKLPACRGADVHVGVVARVHAGQMLKQLVVGCGGHLLKD